MTVIESPIAPRHKNADYSDETNNKQNDVEYILLFHIVPHNKLEIFGHIIAQNTR